MNINKLIHRYTLEHAHPMKFVCEVLGVMWGVYFLWHHNWIAAALISMALFLGSTLVLRNKPIDYLSRSALGKIMLVYATPVNFLFYNLSALPVVYGVWSHQPVFILLGITIFLLPHAWGWKGLKPDS